MSPSVPASPPPSASGSPFQARLTFDDNALLPSLFGERDQHLERIEKQLGIALVPRGNVLSLSGPTSAVEIGRAVLANLYDRLKRGYDVDAAEVDAALRIAGAADIQDPTLPLWQDPPAIKTRKRLVNARSVAQGHYIRALKEQELVFGLGPAGTGKTYLAVAAAVDMMMSGQVQRIILSRPAVEAGERLGFLPGDLKEKVDPYLRPLYDALHDMLPGEQVVKRLASGDIEVAPLAFMRGRTLSNAFVILDEAQNTTEVQMKMFLTRLGEGSRMAVTGDLSQIDLPRGVRSGLLDAVETLDGVEGVGMVRFTEHDVVRHPLVARIVRAYEERARRREAKTLKDGEP
ncbi:MAG TPA: PhoH family protein [Stellaceae bacterium]|jgi:phosphate starvation-inducible PhoH-like protein|nr:PhoH family protein [Stellaceae bacterium]